MTDGITLVVESRGEEEAWRGQVSATTLRLGHGALPVFTVSLASHSRHKSKALLQGSISRRYLTIPGPVFAWEFLFRGRRGGGDNLCHPTCLRPEQVTQFSGRG
ncbi:hypothetical protein Pmani_009979 [Petrolisthes manimaculis]|uniref:Uncharacterized protein n=1 Tax=Petrolisthes manimaculis TaxID=1843537 RepID=A0AAE1UD42_9EUCA|nr:hypothetical protein Pmani_009979 [Petrolisthes manimaculis]